MTKYKISNAKKRFIENGFPTAKSHLIAIREGNSKRPIYQIHKWWARRLGSVFRTLLISSFSPAHESQKDIWSKYYNGFSLQNKVIYDPMMGGGTTLVEALRLGCNVIGSDINPVAWFVTKKEIEAFDEITSDVYFNKIKERVGEKIKNIYKTKCNNNHKCDMLYAIWARQITCQDCKKESDLFTSRIIREDEKTKTVHCPNCNDIFQTKQKSQNVKCKTCKKTFDILKRNSERGYFTCSCKSKTKITHAVKLQGRLLDSRIICIEFDCKQCGRGFKKPTKKDFKQFDDCVNLLSRHRSKLPIPKQRVHPGHGGDIRPKNHGFDFYYQLFNARQLYSLALTLKEIKKIPDQNIKEFLLLAFSSSLETNNALCKYETNWGKISALFAFPSYHVPERYCENNLWGNGRGSFVRSYLKLKRGKKYASNSYELLQPIQYAAKKKRKFTGDSIFTNMEKYSSKERVRILCRNSKKMPMIKSKTVDVVLTDPPYFDVMSYSRLANFFFVWLQMGLKDKYPWFRQDSSASRNEIVLDDYLGKDIDNFVSEITKVFKECHRVLKDEGIIIFTFHHSKEWAWKNLKDALTTSGFTATASQVIRSEGKTGFKKNGNTGYDVCVVARKTKTIQQKNIQNRKLVANYDKSIQSMKQHNNSINTADRFTAVMGQYMLSGKKNTEDFLESNTKFKKTVSK